MNNSLHNFDNLKNLSIRARFAYSMVLVELYLHELSFRDSLLDDALSKAWLFTSSTDLGEWSDIVRDVLPEPVLYGPRTEEHIVTLRVMYQKMPARLIQMFDNTIHVGICNLFVGMVGYGQTSLNLLIENIKLFNEDFGYIPNIPGFQNQKFTRDPFGEPFTRIQTIYTAPQ